MWCRASATAKSAVALLTATCQQGCDDFDGQHDVVCKRSLDRGQTWGPLQVVGEPVRDFNCTLGELMIPRCEFWDPTLVWDDQQCEFIVLSACKLPACPIRTSWHS